MRTFVNFGHQTQALLRARGCVPSTVNRLLACCTCTRRAHVTQPQRLDGLPGWSRQLSSDAAAGSGRRDVLSSYPSKVDVNTSVAQLVSQFSHLQAGQVDSTGDTKRLTGRVLLKREMGQLIFYTIENDGHKLQVKASKKQHDVPGESFKQSHRGIGIGDIIECAGRPCRTKTGELSIDVTQVRQLSRCLHGLPNNTTMKNANARYRRPYLPLMCDLDKRNHMLLRSRIIRFIRDYLHDRHFVEVETPILSAACGGAVARPFVTHHNSLHTDLVLRVAPELYLKMLVIGGLNRVFELGKVFRNEGMSPQHSPEFTVCELYQAYANYEDLMQLTEDLLLQMCRQLLQVTAVDWSHVGRGDDDEPEHVRLDFAGPFPRISVYDELQRRMNVQLPDPESLHTDEARVQLLNAADRCGVKCEQPRTSARLLDKMIGAFIEPTCIQPTFLVHHPLVLSPLAKACADRPGLAERFELFVATKEMCNAYSELNDPDEQRRRFQLQAEMAEGDVEVPAPDEQFCRALEYGLPPTAGWGLGVDRLVMLLTDAPNIKEVQLFPMVAPQTHKSAASTEEGNDD